MVRRITLCAALLYAAVAANAQTRGLLTSFPQQFFNNNGQPLAGGLLYTCVAGAACPGSPLTTWTDAQGFTSNSNPVVLDASGVGNVWGDCSLSYKLVLRTSAGVAVKTTDNVTCNTGNGTAPTNYWTLVGTTISNNNAAGAGDVSMGGGLSVANDITIAQNLKLRDDGGSPHYALISGGTLMTADVTWRWPVIDTAGALCSNGTGTLSFGSCGGSGGGGSPGGNATDIQFSTGTTFGGSDNFTWDNTNQRVVLTAASSSVPGIVVLSGWIQADNGFLAINNASPGTALNYNVIQAPTGGMAANSFTATKYTEIGSNAGTPTATNAEAGFPHTGAMYCDTTGSPCVPKVYNGVGWVSLATGGATSPGGADTNVQFNSGGSFAGTSNLIFSAQRLTVIGSSSSLPAIYAATGYVQADAGFVASPGSATRYNVIQAPAGGMAANSFTATTYIQTGTSPGPFSSSPPTPTSTDAFHPGAISWDVSAAALKVYNGTTWNTIGGGGATPGTPTTSIQFNSGGSFAGSANLTWNGTAVAINPGSAVAGLVVVSGYAQADVGFLAAVNGSPATALQYNSIQSPTGGLYGKSVRAINYTQLGNAASIPTLTGGDTYVAGASYFDTSLGVQRVFNGSTWVSLATGGVVSVNSLTGALTIAGTSANQITVTPGGSTITLSLPQNIGTASAVNFASVTTTGAHTSTASGATVAFNVGTAFSVTGAGTANITNLQIIGGAGNGINVTSNPAANSIQTIGGINLCTGNTCTGGSALQVVGSTVITSSGYWVGAVATPTGGSPSIFWTGPSGNFYTRPVAGMSTSIGTCPSTLDGWLAVTSFDQYIVVCIGGARYRAALNPF